MELYIQLPSNVQFAIDRLEQSGYDAYIVGGCVRDSILGKEPNDWDITTSASPEDTLKAFSDHRTIETGLKHGTVSVVIDGEVLEITTYRIDGEYLDNRHPESVSFSRSIADDLARRDFTVNAMAYHPVRGLVDLYGGREDIRARVIRCVGAPCRRFREDGLRILRAIRFASVLDFTVEENTANAVHECRNLLSNIAAERIREEFCKLLCGKGAVPVLRDFGDVCSVFLPEMGRCIGFLQNSKYHCHDVFEHTLAALAEENTGDLVTRLSILFHDIGKPLCYTEDAEGGHFKGHASIGVEITDAVLHRLRFDNDRIARICELVALHDLPIPATARSVKRLMRRLSDADILRLLEIKRCDRIAHAEDYRELPPELRDIPELIREIRAADACLHLSDLAVTGNDLIAMGMQPGKAIGVLLNQLFEEVLDDKLPNDRELLLQTLRERIQTTLPSET